MLFKDDYLILNNFVYGIINKNLNNVIQIKNYVIREGEDNGSLINLLPFTKWRSIFGVEYENNLSSIVLSLYP